MFSIALHSALAIHQFADAITYHLNQIILINLTRVFLVVTIMTNKMSNEEIDLRLSQLRDLLLDVLPENDMFDNDFYLYRWLKQNKMKVSQTAKHIKESIQWRKQNNLDELKDGNWAFWAPGIENYIKICFDGVSKTGQPVVTVNGENLDVREMFESCGKETYIRHGIQMYAKLEKCLLDHYKMGPPNSNDHEKDGSGADLKPKYNSLWDSAAPIILVSYKNFANKNLTYVEGLQAFMEVSKIGMTYFPAVISTLYFVNLNKVSSVVIKMVKPLLPLEAFNLEVFDTDKSAWSKVLLEHIEADQLQVYFGGTKETEDKKY